jgi:hypothetical protein
VFGQFVDEADNLFFGWLITRGIWPYRDAVALHFPFAYYWMGAVAALFGSSQAAARISLLVLQVVLLGVSMRLSGLYLPVGIAALAWGLTSHFHRGNLVLYDTFDGLFIISSFVLVFSMLLEPSGAKRSSLVLTGAWLACAMISNPLMIYPSAVALSGVWLSGLRTQPGRSLGEAWRRVMWVGGSAGTVLGLWVLFLVLSGSLYEFYRQTIWFNANVFSKYTNESPLRLDSIFYQLVSGLDVLDPRWRQHLSAIIDPGVVRFRVADESLYYSWIFSSFTFRISILLCTLGLLFQRKYLAGFFLYFFSATLLMRADTGWHTIPFTWLSLFAGSYLLTSLAAPFISNPTFSFSRFGWLPWRLAYLTLLGMYTWSALFGGYYLLNYRQALSDRRYLNRIERFGDELRRITCQRRDVELLVYPFNPMVYLLPGFEPASRYTFMYPWLAEIGQQEVIDALQDHPSAVVQVKWERRIWQDVTVKEYLPDLYVFLRENYYPVSDTLWISPELARECTANLVVPFSGESSDDE